MRELFNRIAHKCTQAVGSPMACILAGLIVLVWLITGPFFHYSNTWQLIINTGTTVVTFLMVFLIQNAQNRDTKVIQLKLDELIFSTKNARNGLINMEDFTEEEILKVEAEFKQFHAGLVEKLKKDRAK